MKLTITANKKAEIAQHASTKIWPSVNIFNWLYVSDTLKGNGMKLLASPWPLFRTPGQVLLVERDDEFDEVSYSTVVSDKFPFHPDVRYVINLGQQRKLNDNPTLIQLTAKEALLDYGVPLAADWPWAPLEGRLAICYDDEWEDFHFAWQMPGL